MQLVFNGMKRLVAASALLLLTSTSALAQDTFRIHSSSGVQSDRALIVVLQDDDDQPQYEVRLPELLVQLAREAERGTVALIPALGHVVALPMPEFALASGADLPVISERDAANQRVFDLLPAGSTPRTFKRVHGLSATRVEAGTTAEADAVAALNGLRSVCLPDRHGYEFNNREESGRGILLSACANFNSVTARELDASIRGTVDISISYVIDDVAFRTYSIHRSGSWNPEESGPPLGEDAILAVIETLDKTLIFEGIDEEALKAAVLMANAR